MKKTPLAKSKSKIIWISIFLGLFLSGGVYASLLSTPSINRVSDYDDPLAESALERRANDRANRAATREAKIADKESKASQAQKQQAEVDLYIAAEAANIAATVAVLNDPNPYNPLKDKVRDVNGTETKAEAFIAANPDVSNPEAYDSLKKAAEQSLVEEGVLIKNVPASKQKQSGDQVDEIIVPYTVNQDVINERVAKVIGRDYSGPAINPSCVEGWNVTGTGYTMCGSGGSTVIVCNKNNHQVIKGQCVPIKGGICDEHNIVLEGPSGTRVLYECGFFGCSTTTNKCNKNIERRCNGTDIVVRRPDLPEQWDSPSGWETLDDCQGKGCNLKTGKCYTKVEPPKCENGSIVVHKSTEEGSKNESTQPCAEGCSTKTNKCNPTPKLGDICTNPEQCGKSMFCQDSKLWADTCKLLKSNGSFCFDDAECSGGYCKKGTVLSKCTTTEVRGIIPLGN